MGIILFFGVSNIFLYYFGKDVPAIFGVFALFIYLLEKAYVAGPGVIVWISFLNIWNLSTVDPKH